MVLSYSDVSFSLYESMSIHALRHVSENIRVHQ